MGSARARADFRGLRVHFLQGGLPGADLPAVFASRARRAVGTLLCTCPGAGRESLALLGEASVGYSLLGGHIRLAGMGDVCAPQIACERFHSADAGRLTARSVPFR